MSVNSFIAVSAWGESVDSSTQGPLSFFVDGLQAHGLTVVSKDSPHANFYVSIQHNRKSFKLSQRNSNTTRRVLVAYEPKIVSPEEYRTFIMEKYDAVIRWSHPHTQNNSETVSPAGIYWKQSAYSNLERYSKNQRSPKSIALINAHKHSLIRGSLYSLRRGVIETLAKSLPDFEVYLAGLNWDGGIKHVVDGNLRALSLAVFSGNIPDPRLMSRPIKSFSNLKVAGSVEDGLAFLSEAQFAIVIENEATYLSEKLPNAIMAGCVPIYCGPPLSTVGVPAQVCIQVEPNAESFVEAVKSMTPEIAETIKRAGREWLLDQETAKKYSYDSAMTRLANSVVRQIF